MNILRSIFGEGDEDDKPKAIGIHIIGIGGSEGMTGEGPDGLLGLISALAGAVGPDPETITNEQIIKHLNKHRDGYKDKKIGNWYAHALRCPTCHSVMDALIKRVNHNQMPEGDEPFGLGADMIIKALKAANK